jgi:dienelactone hydrolase
MQKETMKFPTRSPGSFRQTLAGVRALPEEIIDGLLMLPDARSGKMALVITSIGSRGLTSGREELYADALTRAGIAMLIVDSYTGRGFTETVSDQGRLSYASSVVDSLFALDAIRTDTRFDPAKTALLGYSRGGLVSVLSYDTQLQDAVLGGKATFCAHVGLYPPCYMQWENPRPTKASLLMLFGGNDVQAPPEPGLDYAKRLNAAGGKVETIVYPQAVHSFDASHPATPHDGVNLGLAQIKIHDDGTTTEISKGVKGGDDWAQFLRDVRKACGRPGSITGHGPLPRNIAVKPIVTFLQSAFEASRSS